MIVGIIPARFASTRLMGKPLADIGGKTLIERTYEQVIKSKLIDEVIIAVDDEKIFNVVKDFGAEVKLTPNDLATSLDRFIHVAKDISADIIVNIHGNQPFIKNKMVDEVIEPLLFDKEIQITTLAKRIETVEDLKSSSVVKLVFDYNNLALYFSRSPIPFVSGARTNLAKINTGEIYKNLGFFAFRKESVNSLCELKPTDLELIENLEQLRILEHGFKIKIVTTDQDCFSVDTPDDLKIAREYYYKTNSKKNG